MQFNITSKRAIFNQSIITPSIRRLLIISTRRISSRCPWSTTCSTRTVWRVPWRRRIAWSTWCCRWITRCCRCCWRIAWCAWIRSWSCSWWVAWCCRRVAGRCWISCLWWISWCSWGIRSWSR